ncbi:TetR/AcrR family transcriptional regulator [Zavarzinia sp. CC-PAN008]|uniref:TetR/AcrR family transcriptional regulator n=1 Tax=Zavarzinia sp. CC-PAN008 TaxID=3243332 RepID=UPI003F74830E
MGRKVGSDGARTLEAIRQAATRLIARHGFEAMSLRQLAREVGLQTGALHRYFPSKTDLLKALMVDHLEALLAGWAAEKPHGAEPLAALHAFCAFHIRTHVERRLEVFVANMELRSLPGADYQQVVALRRRYEAALREILEAGVAAGTFRLPDVHVASYAVLALLTSVATWYREDGRLSQGELTDIYTALVIEGVGLQGPAKT